jgi:hypothetical protein
VNRVTEWEEGYHRFMRGEHEDLLKEIEDQEALDDELFKKVDDTLRAFNRQFGVEGGEERAGAPSAAEVAAKDSRAAGEEEAQETSGGAGVEPQARAPEVERRQGERRRTERRTQTAQPSEGERRRGEERRKSDRRKPAGKE